MLFLLALPFLIPSYEDKELLPYQGMTSTIIPSSLSFVFPFMSAMEDWTMLAADCVVISCCCQCMILQIIVFYFIKLPCKIFQKTKQYAKKKLRVRYRKKKGGKIIESVKGRFVEDDQFVELNEGSIRIQVEEFNGCHVYGRCMEEVERVMEEFSEKGEFAFGSFWGRGSTRVVSKQEIDLSLVQFELIEIVSPFICTN